MFQVPVTFAYGFAGCSEAIRANIMQEFAANGAKHLVLSNPLISQIMADANLPAYQSLRLRSAQPPPFHKGGFEGVRKKGNYEEIPLSITGSGLDSVGLCDAGIGPDRR